MSESISRSHENDLIGRQAAIETAVSYIEEWNGAQSKFHRNRITERFLNLPSAQQERKKGKWIKLDMHAHIADHKCTACGQECYVPTCMGEPMYTYCPNCGAYMRGEK